MLHILDDDRVQCTSLMTSLAIGQYLDLVERVYEKRGGLEGQRSPLKTKTGITIRNRLVSDIQNGAVIPPVVVGVLAPAPKLDELKTLGSRDDLGRWLDGLEPDAVSIIDGMQRTTALRDAIKAKDGVKNREMRVEFWVSEHLNSLIYRMLVLNSGQVPWELARQLETVYSQFKRQIVDAVGSELEILDRDDRRRRSQPGQYQSSNIIELLLIFSSRKTDIDIKDRVAEDFARLDAIETSAHHEFVDYFIDTLRMMSGLDVALGFLGRSDTSTSGRLQSGKDIFASFPAMAGFAAAVSVHLFDEPGFDINWDVVPSRMDEVRRAVEVVIGKLQEMPPGDRAEFVQLDLLEQRLSVGRRGGVGRFEREAFKRAFGALIRNSERLTNLAPCWLA